LLIMLRFVSLEIDPPLFFKGYTQAHLTDPYHLTHFARNEVLFDRWNPYDFHRWDIFKYSLISGVSYLVFSIGGVSRITANLSALVLNLSGLFFFVAGLWRYRPRIENHITLIIVLVGSMLFFYGRLPFLENGLIAISGLAFFIFARYHNRPWGQLLVGLLIALAALGGKLFGFILLGPAVLTCLIYYRRAGIRPSLLILAGAAGGIVLYALIFFGGDFGIMKSYYLEQTVGLYGTPGGFKSPVSFFVKLLTYGAGTGFFSLSPFMVILTAVALIVIFLQRLPDRPLGPETLPLVFAGLWLVCGVVGLAPFNYRPLRYAVFLFPPMAAIIAFTLAGLAEKKPEFRLRRPYLALPVIFFLLWYILTQVTIYFAADANDSARGQEAFPYTLAASLVIVGAVYVWLRRKDRLLPRPVLMAVLVPLAAAMLVNQSLMIYQGLAWPRDYLRQFNRELSELVDEKAVISGPYGRAFTIDNDLGGIIYYFGLARVEFDLFDRFPISHVISDGDNWQRGQRDFPFLKDALLLTLFTMRDFSAGLYRIPGSPVPLTEYEKGLVFLETEQPDSALYYLETFHRRYPDNLTGAMALARAYIFDGNLDKHLESLQALAEQYPDNLRVHVFCSRAYYILYTESKLSEFKQLADYHARRAFELNPAIE